MASCPGDMPARLGAPGPARDVATYAEVLAGGSEPVMTTSGVAPTPLSLPRRHYARGSSDRLELAEATQLVAALTAWVAEQRGVRALLVKGLSLERHGLRQGHASADVDLLVEPDKFEDLIRAFLERGWSRRPDTLMSGRMTTHSVALIKDGWPNDIDLHREYPGLLVGPARAFDVLWDHRVPATFAGIRCWIPDRESAIVIWALHSLRGTDRQPRHRAELRQLTREILPRLSERGRVTLGLRIGDLGAAPLRPLCLPAGAWDEHGAPGPAALIAWNRKLAQNRAFSMWSQVLKEAHPREYPYLLFRAVWPSGHDLQLMDPGLVNTPVGRLRARLLRVTRLARK